jgi:hypothetical protein
MKANFQLMDDVGGPWDPNKYAQHLADYNTGFFRIDQDRTPPEGYESYRCVDMLGPEFMWVNENFPREKYTWYLWFESIFLVPPEMATFLQLRHCDAN